MYVYVCIYIYIWLHQVIFRVEYMHVYIHTASLGLRCRVQAFFLQAAANWLSCHSAFGILVPQPGIELALPVDS